MWRPGIFLPIVLGIFFVCRGSRADAALVVLVRPPARSAIVSEAITRIRGELVADGFEVSVVNASPGSDARSALARAEKDTSAAATVALFLHADARAAEVWVIDRLTAKTVVRAVELTAAPPGSAPEVLARRSVELLRASLLEILVDTREEPSERRTARTKASEWAERALEPRRSPWGLEAGAQLLASFGGAGGAWMPVGRLRLGLGPRLATRLTVSGLGTRPRLEFAEGRATLSQELGLLELVGDLTSPGWLTPVVSLGAGVYHIGVDGSATWPYTGLRGDRFSFAADVGGGLALAITPSLALSLEAHGILVTPYPVIRFLDDDSIEIRNPLVSGVLTLTGWP